MDFHTIVAAIRRSWWILAVAISAGVFVSVLASRQVTPEYTATTRLFISATGGNSSSEAFSGGQFAEQRAESYVHIITSEQMTQRVVDDLRLPMSAQELSGRVDAAIVPRTVLVDVSATDPSGKRAAAIANSLAKSFIGYVQPLETPAGQSTPRSTVSVVSPAEVPQVPSSPKIGRNAAYGVVGGLAVGLLVLMLTRVLSTRINSVEELRRFTGAPTIGPIATPDHAARVGKHRLVDWVPEEAEQLRRLRVQLEAHDPSPHVLLIAPAFAGPAAASVGAGLALAFAETGEATALVELDPAYAPSYGIEDGAPGLAELIEGKSSFEEVVHSTSCENLFLVRGGSMPGLEALLSSASTSAFIDDLRKECDRVVIITPSVIDSSAASVLSAVVDADLLVVQKRRTHRRQLDRALGELKAARAHLLAVVLTKS
ncbi:Wzz/FepE/Etk N-terminal domain-containing protein [Mycobacterium sp. 21AC1]|uniref:Wzz/FepE/Etk N-terminal domain-containing protein n=1 Tax=[Mycobacterium] appelbergii TaxID=2939269 RepID=UPI0029391582|nr:Wzz/FepE/Etk N-terminal domain-containing protein [Mycobacterium sp. 21AC1]MDV3128670.1 Wzz/FepE/Etk N-terminal domain-containing protein [Mycobacterium sp. 21AC1]